MSLPRSARRDVGASSSLDPVAMPFPVPTALQPSGFWVSLSPPLLLSTNLAGVEALPLSPLLEDGLAVFRVPAAIVLEVTFAVLFAPLMHQDTVAGMAVAIRLPWAAPAARAAFGRRGRADGNVAGVAVTQPTLTVACAKAPCVAGAVAACQRAWPGHRHGYPDRSVVVQREKPVVRRRTQWGQGVVEIVLVCALVAVVVIVVLVVIRGQPAAPVNIVNGLGAGASPSPT
jgi:hypothetical protein